ncbi:MAG: carboxylesterase/lipase family protein [Acidobacteriota bacterium]
MTGNREDEGMIRGNRAPRARQAVGVVLAVFALGAGSLRAAERETPGTEMVVKTAAGNLRGVARPGGGAQFLGIPYARPPVGRLRWRPPVPARHWSGVRAATAFGSPCAQPALGGWNRHDAENGRENCLFLNVIAPAWPAARPLPVMVWLHGGANLGGSAGGALYSEGALANHGVVLVTLNYRLGIFGFMALPALDSESPHRASGNYGLMDQILALRWVHANIAAFGGDPGNVTVFGQSAGAMDTGMLMTSPAARGLFRKAIAESGAAFAPRVQTLAQAESMWQAAVAPLKPPPGPHGIAALRRIPAPELIARLGAAARQWPGIGPNVDGWILPRAPEAVFAAGQEAPIPLLLGTTSREFGSAEPLHALRAEIERTAGASAPAALEMYGLANNGPGASDPLYGSAAVQWAADTMFHCPIATQALWHSAAGLPVYEYELDHPIPGQEAQGAIHSGDLPYVFGYFPKTGNIAGKFTPVDFKLADLIETYWTNFARGGDPNGPGLPQWPRLEAASQPYLQFGLDGRAAAIRQPLRAAQCGLYREWTARGMSREP